MKTNPLMLYGEDIAVYCDSRGENVSTLCGQNTKAVNRKRRETYRNN
jgi:hypothetical protein